MPHFTRQFALEGPVVNAFVGVSQARADALKAAGQPVPTPAHVIALVDTGASGTCIDPAILTGLGLTATGSVPVLTPSTGSTPHTADQYDVSFLIPTGPNQTPLVIPALPVMCSELAVQGIQALIGRDILRNCLLVYNGDIGLFSLSY